MESELIKLGFAPRQIVEVIVSTYDENKTPDAAPMGVTSREGRLIIRPYTTTQTYLNLMGRRCGVVNLTGDPELFYRTAIKESNEGEQVPAEWFLGAEKVDAPRLRGAEAYLEVSVVDQNPIASDRAEFTCEVVQLEVASAYPKAYSRAAFALIESVIHATRLKEYLASGRMGEAEQLLSMINHYRALVERVAPGSRYTLLMADLLKRVESWRTKP